MEMKRLEAEMVERFKQLAEHSTPQLRAIRRDFSKRLSSHSADLVLELSLRLNWSRDVPRFVAYELVQHHDGARGLLKPRIVEEFGRGMSDWGTVDAFACYVAGPAWREGQLPDALFKRWARSSDRWWRRAALVSTVPLNVKTQKGKGDADKTLTICVMLMNDRDDMVVKALSWALRALAKRNSKAVTRFLGQHKPKLPARVLREVNNKLKTGLKNPHR